jgi:hypothetical protein
VNTRTPLRASDATDLHAGRWIGWGLVAIVVIVGVVLVFTLGPRITPLLDMAR